MFERRTSHLSPAEIMAAAGGVTDAGVDSHLESCLDCQRDVKEWRESLADLAPLGEISVRREGCPSLAELAEYCYARLQGDVEPMDHLKQCEACAGIVGDLTGPDPRPAPWWRSAAAWFSRGLPLGPLGWRYATAGIATVVAAGVAIWWSASRASDPARLLAQAYTASRPFEYRLPDDGYSAVDQQRGAGTTFGRPPFLAEAELQVQRRLSAGRSDPATLGLKGRAEMLEGDYESAIASLTRALELDPKNAQLLVDLGCAYALRGDVEKQKIDYAPATEQFLAALRLEPSNRRALFNLAIVYEKLSMLEEAIATWEKLIAVEPSQGWLREARQRVAALRKIREGKKKADEGIHKDPRTFLALREKSANFEPEMYHETFWQAWLPAIADPDAREAARIVAQDFHRRIKDPSLADTLSAAEKMYRAGKPGIVSLNRLAQAISLNQRGQGDSAAAAAREAMQELDASGLAAAAMRARIELAYSLRRAAMLTECLALTGKVLKAPAVARGEYVWLGGEAHLEHAMCIGSLGRRDEERAELEAARASMERAGLRMLALRAAGIITATDNLVGNYASIWNQAAGGLAEYWRTPASHYRAQQFQYDLGNSAAACGWKRVAVVMGRAAAESAGRAGNPGMEAADRVELAALLSSPDDRQEKETEIDSAAKLVHQLPAGPTLNDLNWTLSMERASAEVAAGRGSRVLEELDRLARDSAPHNPDYLAQLDQARGMALAALGQLPEAAEAFRRVIEWNQKKVVSAPRYADRAAELETAADSYRSLAQIQLVHDRDAGKALATWRLYRGGGAGEPDGPRAAPAPFDPPVRFLTYAILPAGVVVWNDDGRSVSARIVDAPVGEIEKECALLQRLCSSPAASEEEIHKTGSRLYRWLVEPELRRCLARRISVDADLWLASIPFAALTDDGGAYLVKRYSFESGAQRAALDSSDRAQISNRSRALIVSAPVAREPGGKILPVLNGAAAEASEVASRFSAPLVLKEDAADGAAIAASAAQAEVFHFAGHGWSDAGKGALLLPAVNGESRFVTAGELEAQDWSHCALAVLSACLTAGGVRRGAVDSRSLVRAMLSAGAKRVVAARWSVDSAATRALMDQFYARLLEGARPPEALALAANFLRSQVAWSRPYYWAGFDVFGRP